MGVFLDNYGKELYPDNLFEGLPERNDDLDMEIDDLPVFRKFSHPFIGWRWYVFSGTKLANGDYDLYGYVTNADGGEIGFFRFSQLKSCLALPVPGFKGRFSDIRVD